MAFLVKDLVDRQIFGGVRLVAGVLNVSNPILWVNVMEILDTPRSLNEGELVVSTGYGLEDQSLHKDLIHQLKKRGGQRSGDPAGLLYRSDTGIHYRRRKQRRAAGAGAAGTAVIFRDPSCAYGSDHGKQSYFQKAGPGTGHTAHCTWKKIKYQ